MRVLLQSPLNQQYDHKSHASPLATRWARARPCPKKGEGCVASEPIARLTVWHNSRESPASVRRCVAHANYRTETIGSLRFDHLPQCVQPLNIFCQLGYQFLDMPYSPTADSEGHSYHGLARDIGECCRLSLHLGPLSCSSQMQHHRHSP